MAITRTTAAAAVGKDDNKINLTSATGFAVGQVLKIDNEYSVIIGLVGTVAEVRTRGMNGGKSQAHTILAPITTGLASDFQDRVNPTDTPDVTLELSYGADGALAVPIKDTIYSLTKATAGAYTLGAPVRDDIRLRLVNGKAAAHVVTATGLLDNGVTGGAKNTATFAAFIGSAIELVSQNAKWVVQSANLVTVA